MSDAATLLREGLRSIEALDAGVPVPSPCISVCRIDERTGWCEGCFRTREEIGAWLALDGPGRRAVWARLATRAQRTEAP